MQWYILKLFYGANVIFLYDKVIAKVSALSENSLVYCPLLDTSSI